MAIQPNGTTRSRLPGARRLLGRPSVLFGLVVLAGVVLPLAVRLGVGAEPANDEWSYAKAAVAMHAGHGVALQGFDQMFLIGQLVAGQPFLAALGGGVTALAVFGGVAAVLWLGTVLALTRPMLGTSRALLLVLVIAVCPVFALLASSYMTDVPAAASAAIALLLGVRAMERASAWRFVVALVVTALAFTIREQAAVVLVTLLVTVAARWAVLDRRFRTLAVGSTALCLVVCVVLEHLRHGVPHGDAPPFGFGSIHLSAAPVDLARGVFTVGLLLAPLIVGVLPGLGRSNARRAALVGAGTVAIAVWLLLGGPDASVLLDNYVQRDGAYPTALVGSPPLVFGAVSWPVLQAVAVVAAVGLCVEFGNRLRTRRGLRQRWREVPVRTFMVYAHGVLLAGLYLVLAFLGEHQYDRYVLPLLPAVGAFLLRRPGPDAAPRDVPEGRPALRWPLLCCAVMAVVTAVLTVTTFVRDDAVWRAASRLSARGVSPTLINAGSAWDGWHATTPLERDEKPGVMQYDGDLWAQRFPRSADCYAVSLSVLPRADWRLIEVARARPYGTLLGSFRVYTYQRIGGHLLGGARCAPVSRPAGRR